MKKNDKLLIIILVVIDLLAILFLIYMYLNFCYYEKL